MVFYKQCQGNPGSRIHTRTIGVSSYGVKYGVHACILRILASIVILCCVQTVL